MGSLSNINAVNMDPGQSPPERSSRSSAPFLKRIFSRDPTPDSPGCTYDVNTPPNQQYSLCGKEFLLKIAQIVVSVICAGIYTEDIQTIFEYSISSQLFPNVVYSCCIINTSVIALGYVIGQVMPEVLIRVFDAIAVILFFTTACIVFMVWYIIGRKADDIPGGLVLFQALLCIVNVVLYSVDLGFSMVQALRVINMGSLPNIVDVCLQPSVSVTGSENRRPTLVLRRLFSRESIASSPKYTYVLYPPSNYDYSLCGKEFLLKLAQILVCIVCAGLFTDGVQQNLDVSMTEVLFPNIVFSSCIINTSVIALGYALGQVMPEVLIRTFNIIAIMLFFVSTCISFNTWRKTEIDNVARTLLLAQVCTSVLNVVLYGVDLGFSIRETLRGI